MPQERIANVALLCHNNDMQTVVKTLRIRVKDKHASVLRRMALNDYVIDFARAVYDIGHAAAKAETAAAVAAEREPA